MNSHIHKQLHSLFEIKEILLEEHVDTKIPDPTINLVYQMFTHSPEEYHDARITKSQKNKENNSLLTNYTKL